MAEGLNHWHFVIAAYAITFVVTGGLVGWSWSVMRKAEARRERSRER